MKCLGLSGSDCRVFRHSAQPQALGEVEWEEQATRTQAVRVALGLGTVAPSPSSCWPGFTCARLLACGRGQHSKALCSVPGIHGDWLAVCSACWCPSREHLGVGPWLQEVSSAARCPLPAKHRGLTWKEFLWHVEALGTRLGPLLLSLPSPAEPAVSCAGPAHIRWGSGAPLSPGWPVGACVTGRKPGRYRSRCKD